MKDKIVEIIQKNYNEYKGINEAELHSAEEIELLIKKEVLKSKIEEHLRYIKMFKEQNKQILIMISENKIDILQQQLKQLENESN